MPQTREVRRSHEEDGLAKYKHIFAPGPERRLVEHANMLYVPDGNVTMAAPVTNTVSFDAASLGAGVDKLLKK